MAFGAPTYVLTQFLEAKLIRIELPQDPNSSYLFRRSKLLHEVNGIWKSVWSCYSCERLRKQDIRLQIRSSICRLHLQHNANGESIITNPVIGHHPNCIGIPNVDIEAKQLQREMNKDCKRGKKRPRQAYVEAAAEITVRFAADDDMQEAVETQFPDYKKARRSLFRHSEKGTVAVVDPRQIPAQLRCTLRGRNAAAGSRFQNENWLLYESAEDEPLMLMFASHLDLENLHQSEIWICDGTFKVTPDGFSQLYTVHGFGRFPPEVLPCCSVLLSSKTIRDYCTMLQQLQTALVNAFGNIGRVHTVLVDFEVAMHQAIRQVMPFARITGCNYHFGQALVKKMGDVGLKNYLAKPPEIEPDQQRNPENPLRIWFGMVKSIALLPPSLVRLAWSMMKERIPELQRNDEAKLQNFVQYFDNYWIDGNQVPIEVWNHWLSMHLRTTNHAEGYHHAINANEIAEMRPALRNFLAALQKSHNTQQQHVRKLIAGTVQPKPRHELYANLHQQIENEKRNFYNGCQHLWNVPNFDMWQLFNHNFNDYQFLCRCIEQFLSFIRFRVGDKDNVNPQN